jgi:hypothetical protein
MASDPAVRQVGTVTDIDGIALAIGVDHDTVSIGTPGVLPHPQWRFDGGTLTELARLLAAATFEAGGNFRSEEILALADDEAADGG